MGKAKIETSQNDKKNASVTQKKSANQTTNTHYEENCDPYSSHYKIIQRTEKKKFFIA